MGLSGFGGRKAGNNGRVQFTHADGVSNAGGDCMNENDSLSYCQAPACTGLEHL